MGLIALVTGVLAAEPKIYLVEYDPRSNSVLLHFDTEAFRAYRLEYQTSLVSTQWQTMATIPAYPFGNHYVIADFATNTHRFYRLRFAN